MKKLLAVLLLTSTLVFGQTTTINVTYTWTAPTTGTPVHHYVVQTSSNGTTWTTLTGVEPTARTVTVAAPVGVPIQVRVAGVDAQNRQGSWSIGSDPFVPDAGPPGVPGTPVRTVP